MPNPKLETYKNKATGTVYDYTDAAAQAALADILDGTDIDSFSDVESVLADKVDKVTGKGLSTNDYDNTAKGIVDNIQSNVIANTKLIKDTVGWSGKNKFRYPYRNTTKTDHGITFTDNGNGSITVSGTNDGTESKFFFETENQPNAREYLTSLGEVILTGGNANARLIMSGFDDSGHSVIDTGQGATFTFANVSHAFQMMLSVPPNTVFSTPVTIYPMFRDADILDPTYEPYFGSTAFPRSEQAVLGAKQWFDASRYASNTSATPTITNKGKTINVANSTAASYAFAIWTMDVVPNTDYKISSNLTITSGKGGIKIETTAGTQIAISSAYTTSGEIEFSFNSGNNTAVRISLFSTFGTSETGDITFDDFLISLASDTDRSFAPYAMTNRELTENKVDLSNLTLLTSSDDLNNIKNGGVYSWGGTSPTNTPESIGWAFMIVSKRSDNFLNQMVYKNNAIYTRLYDNGTWGSWYKMAGTAL